MKFNVVITITGRAHVTVEADNADDARSLVMGAAATRGSSQPLHRAQVLEWELDEVTHVESDE